MSASQLGVVCDFDGTATVTDIGDEVSRHFGGAAHWEAESARFRRGELDTRGIIEAIYTRVTAGEDEIREFAARVALLRPGFTELVAACRDTGTPFILASGGLTLYIDAVLRKNLAPGLRAHVEVMANEATCDAGGLRVRFPTEDASREQGCTACGSCKRVAVRRLRDRGVTQLLGLGDGFADRCLAERADVVFAREGSYLARFCTERGIAHTAFQTLHVAAAAVRDRA